MTVHPETGQAIVDRAWLARHAEPVLEPDLPIIDAHHHIWQLAGYEYGADDFCEDLATGHKVEASVFVECGYGYRRDGPESLRPVGETEGIAALTAGQANGVRMCAGIVGHADLRLGAAVDDVLQAHIAAGDGRFRGIRQSLAVDAAQTRHLLPPPPYHMAADPAFRKGFSRLSRFGLSFDAWLFHPQIPELTELARAFPETPIVLDHMGGVLGIGPYAGRREAVFQDWRRDMQLLAACPNVWVKLGGVGMYFSGFDFHCAAEPPSSAALAAAWRPYVETCIAAFGVERCMFESNFPVDKAAASYCVVWNAFKRLAAGASAEEKEALLHGTARRFYRL